MGQGIQIRLYRMRSRHLSDKLHDGCQNDVKMWSQEAMNQEK